MTIDQAPSFLRQRATVLKILCVPAVVIVLATSTLFFGSTSHRLRTGSVAGMLGAASEAVRLQGAPLSSVKIAGSLSTVDDYWAEFFVESLPLGPRPFFAGELGFAQYQEHTVDGIPSYQWIVVALGPKESVACSNLHAVAIPPRVLRGFHVSCSR